MAPSRRFNVYWTTPAIMITSLIAASMFAVGHHLYYNSLAGHTSPTGYLHIAGQSISRQQFHLSIGNTFAYLVKLSLSLAVTTAYIQAFWYFMQNVRKSTTLSELDSVYSALSNLLEVFRLKAWRTSPALLLLAVVSWCLNVASLITPATLSVQSVSRQNSSLIQVPQFSFTNLNFVAGMGQHNQDQYSFNGPSQPVKRIASTVAGIGQILPIAPPAPNTTWTSSAWAPLLQCSEVTGSEREQIYINIWNSIGSSSIGDCGYTYAYLAWVPCALDSHNANLTTSLPFSMDSANGYEGFCGTISFDNVPPPGSLSRLYVAALPSLASAEFTTGLGPDGGCEMIYPSHDPKCSIKSGSSTNCICAYHNTTDLSTTFTNGFNDDVYCPGYRPADFFKDASVTSCEFLNTSISLDFAYPDGVQVIKVRKDSTPPTPLVQVVDVTGPAGPDSKCSILTYSDPPNNVSSSKRDQIPDDCPFDPSAARKLSYLGIIDAFDRLVVGFGGFSSQNSNLGISVLNTILVDTVELAFMRSGTKPSTSSSQGDINDLQHQTMNSTQRAYQGLASEPPRGTRGNIRNALEDLFQNFTISLLAEPYLQPNYSSPFAPERLMNVTSELTLNIYVYASTTLWLAYGLAILFACISVAFGATLMFIHNASYDGNFSTVFRASRTAEISAEVSHGDSAREPLPTYLARARVRFSHGENARSAGTSSGVETTENKGNAVVTSSLLSRDDQAPDRSTLDAQRRGQ